MWWIYEDETYRYTQDTPDYSTLDFNHHLVDNIAIFTAHILFCCCSRVVSSRRTFSRGKVCQALTSYLLVHLTNSTTLTVYIQWYSTIRFRHFLLFTSSEDPLPCYPTDCCRAVVSRTPVVSISRPTELPPSHHSSDNDVGSSNYPAQLTVYESCTTIGVSLPTSLLVVVYFGRKVSTTVTSVVKCSMFTLLQPLHDVSFPPSVWVSFPSKVGKDASGLRVAPNPHALLEANASKPHRPQGMHNILTPPSCTIFPLIFLFALARPQLRRNIWTLSLPPSSRDINLDSKEGIIQGSFAPFEIALRGP